jgi:hypothetical protein
MRNWETFKAAEQDMFHELNAEAQAARAVEVNPDDLFAAKDSVEDSEQFLAQNIREMKSYALYLKNEVSIDEYNECFPGLQKTLRKTIEKYEKLYGHCAEYGSYVSETAPEIVENKVAREMGEDPADCNLNQLRKVV